MGNVLVQESSLRAIAEAIRAQNGTEDTYTPVEMAEAVAAIAPVLLENRTGLQKLSPGSYRLSGSHP